jgi:hypothetical protein
MQTRTVDLNGQRFHLIAIDGETAHDHHGRIMSHFTAGLAKVQGVPVLALMGAVDEEGNRIGSKELLSAAIGQMDAAALAAAMGATAARLTAEENRWLRSLLLSTATVELDGAPQPLLPAMKAGKIKGGPLTIDWLIAQAIDLSVLPFSDLVGSALLTPPGETSKESITS